jgi:hypothetical protein
MRKSQREDTTVNRSFGNVTKFKDLGTTATVQNVIHEETQSRLLMLAAVQFRVFRLPLCCLNP